MATNIIQGGDFRIKGIAGGSITSGNLCMFSNGTIVVATDGGVCAGVAVEDYTTGQNVVLICAPAVVRINAASGTDFAVGDRAYVASSTTIDGGSSTNLSCGTIVDVDPSEAGVCHMSLHTIVNGGQFTHA